jgi:hypothetical protein
MTNSLQKARKGDAMCVTDVNVTGYDVLKNLNYDDRLLKDVINGVGQTLADNITKLGTHDEELLGLKQENEALKLQLDETNVEVAKLRKAIEETLKGLITR